jgi:hypothetical protein
MPISDDQMILNGGNLSTKSSLVNLAVGIYLKKFGYTPLLFRKQHHIVDVGIIFCILFYRKLQAKK